ncbi:hypothetical protein [Streptomyces bluensis]|uniref:ATP-grasp domain-containing protein n=1 Tax=Streptomyces bluensis TaxID=33897 RepID=A0ABW6UMD4_9ACTN
MSETDERRQEHPPPDRAPQRLLLVCPSPRLAHEAVAEGFGVRVLADAHQPHDGTLPPVPVDLVDFTDDAAVTEAIEASVRRYGTERLLASAGSAELPAVTETAARLGVCPNPPDAARLLGEPAAMRALLNGSRHSYVAAARARTARELPDAVEEIGAPVTVRPLAPLSQDSAVRPVETPGEHSYLVEEYLQGPEFGVVTLTVDGMHRVVGIVALRGAWPARSGSLFPALLGERDEAEARAITTELLDLAGYEFGFAYTVVVLTANGPRVVRSQARYPDEPVASLIELATGFCAEAELVQALTGKPVQPPTADRCAAVVFYRLPAGRLLSVWGLEAVSELPGMHEVHFPYTSGDDIPRAGCGAEGYVMLTAASAHDAAQTVAEAQRLLHAEVSPRSEPL